VASVSAEGAPSSGFEVGTSTIIEGKNIVIAGPGSLINIINQVVAPVNVEGMKEDTRLSSTLKIYDKNGDTFTDAQLASLEFKDESGNVLTNHTVEVQVDLWRIRTDIPIRVQTTGSPAWGYRVSGITTIPETISLAGTEDALNALGAMFNVNDMVDVNGVSDDVTAEIDITSTLSEMPGLKLITDADPSVQVVVAVEANGDVTLQIPLSSISFANKPEGMDLVFTPADEVSVKVHALSEEAQKLSAEALALSVDLSVCAEEGSYDIPVQVTLPDGYELASEVTITVVSTKQAVQTEGEGQ
jgi:YbbR domain-containing protein